MPLMLYNSLTRKLESLLPQSDNRLTLYCCGVTVYDHCHLGHGRIFMIYDLLTRLLREQGYNLTFARNITDLDDKIIKKAFDQGCSCEEITQPYIHSMRQVMESLGCQAPSVEPLATESIDLMISMIERLLLKGHAYEVHGEVFFAVNTFKSYGELSHQNLEELVHGARLAEPSVHKKHPNDFTLWKPSKQGEPSWPSPWGLGRPGWHIECSAMIEAIFHDTIDVHLGGADLKFPHHENEIAQSEACFNRPLARHWVHGGFVTVDEIKMSKSLGNFHYLHDIIKEIGTNVLRYFYFTTQYRQPLAFTVDKIQQAERSWTSLNRYLARWLPDHESADPDDQELRDALMTPLLEDLNTPALLATLHQEAKLLEHKNPLEAQRRASTLIRWMDRVLGLKVTQPAVEIKNLSEVVQSLLEQRKQARDEKNYVKSDQLRDQIKALGYQVTDSAQGQDISLL
jgi:cysteinyl-tRNA synthetase